MKSIEIYLYEQQINEGLIKIPKSLYMAIFNHVIQQYISYIYINNDKDLANKLSNKYKVEIIKNFKPSNDRIELKYVIDDLPEKIKNAWHFEIGQLKLIIDWEGKIWGDRPKVNASFEESDDHKCKDCFTINPLSFIEAFKNNDIEKINNIIDKLQYSIYHETSHAVQHGALKWLDKNQIYKSRVIRDNPNSSKEDRRREYLTSNVEYDPTIKTKLGQFRKKFDIKDSNIRKNLAIFVNAIQDTNNKPDEFFKVLKETDPKKWARAVKKFYKCFDLKIEDLLNN